MSVALPKHTPSYAQQDKTMYSHTRHQAFDYKPSPGHHTTFLAERQIHPFLRLSGKPESTARECLVCEGASPAKSTFLGHQACDKSLYVASIPVNISCLQ